MHFARLGPEHGVNFSHYIQHRPAPDEPAALEVRLLPGEILILRGAERDAFLRRFDELDPPASAKANHLALPPGKVEDLMPPAAPRPTRRKTRRG
jgi:hypothetical protein